MGQDESIPTKKLQDLDIVLIIPGADHGDVIYTYIEHLLRTSLRTVTVIYDSGMGLYSGKYHEEQFPMEKLRDAHSFIFCQVLVREASFQVDYSKQDSWFADDSPFNKTLDHLKKFDLPRTSFQRLVGINLGVDFTSDTPSTNHRPDINIHEIRCRVTRNYMWMSIVHTDENEFNEKLRKALLF